MRATQPLLAYSVQKFVKGNALYNKKWSGTSYRKALYQAYQKWMTVTDYDLVSGEYVFNAKTNQYKK